MPLRDIMFCSQKEAQARPAWPSWAVISITGSCPCPANLDPKWQAILRLEFDDIDWEEEPYQLFSEQQAREIIAFAKECAETGIDGILVHCHAGISRSAAVAKWIADRYRLPFPEKYMLYNKHVYATLREEHMIVGY